MDLAITAYMLTLCAAVLFWAGLRYGARHPVSSQFLFALGIALAVWMAWNGGSSLRWAQLMPLSYVLMLSNAFALLVVGSAGLLVGCRCLSRRSQQLAVFGLCMTAAWFIGAALVRPLVQPLNLEVPMRWNDVVCMQTHEASCAPAAAATLLGLHGVKRTETDMAIACLTSSQGTLALGTFRGLCVASRGESISPRALVCKPGTYPAGALRQRLPLLAHVDLSAEQSGTRSRRVLGHAGHAVVVLQQLDDGGWLVADPAVGKVRWRDEVFRRAWIGEGIYLVSK